MIRFASSRSMTESSSGNPAEGGGAPSAPSPERGISAAHRTLNVTDYFNPIDCRSLGVIRVVLGEMEKGQILEVVCNRFQQREISAWSKKFKHPVLGIEDKEGLVKMYIERQGLR